MKHLKLFTESIKDDLQIGDVIICKMTELPMNPEHTEFITFINNNIGTIIDIQHNIQNNNKYIVEYNNIPDDIISYFGYYKNNATHLYRRDIILSAHNTQELNIKLDQNKYNL